MEERNPMKETFITRFPVALFIAFILVAHLFVPQGYQIRINTISEMAAQGLPHGWIMRSGFILFGLTQIIGQGHRLQKQEGSLLTTIPYILYGVSIGLTGIWSTTYPGMVQPNLTESGLHSLFATTAGVALVVTMLLFAWRTKEIRLRLTHLGVAILVLLLSMGFGLLPGIQGWTQRLMYAVSFLWILCCYGKVDKGL